MSNENEEIIHLHQDYSNLATVKTNVASSNSLDTLDLLKSPSKPYRECSYDE